MHAKLFRIPTVSWIHSRHTLDLKLNTSSLHKHDLMSSEKRPKLISKTVFVKKHLDFIVNHSEHMQIQPGSACAFTAECVPIYAHMWLYICTELFL